MWIKRQENGKRTESNNGNVSRNRSDGCQTIMNLETRAISRKAWGNKNLNARESRSEAQNRANWSKSGGNEQRNRRQTWIQEEESWKAEQMSPEAGMYQSNKNNDESQEWSKKTCHETKSSPDSLKGLNQTKNCKKRKWRIGTFRQRIVGKNYSNRFEKQDCKNEGEIQYENETQKKESTVHRSRIFSIQWRTNSKTCMH